MSSEPPAKRQRRTSAILSSDEFEPTTSSSLPLRNEIALKSKSTTKLRIIAKDRRSQSSRKEKGKNTAAPTSAKSSPKSSPEKIRKSKKLEVDNTKNKSLHSFFSKVAEEERWRRRSKTPDVDSQDTMLNDDILDDDDDSIDGALSGVSNPSTKTSRAIKHETVLSKGLQSSQPFNTIPTSSQRFKRPAASNQVAVASKSYTSVQRHNDKPWAERYAPLTLEELAVHKKKVQDVQKWFNNALSRQPHQKVLILKGPAGSGKSTLVHLLAQEQQVELISWQNPDTSEKGSAASALSLSLQFAEFVSRGGEYGALSFGSDAQTNSVSTDRGRILLVEEFPTSMISNSEALDAFRSTLLQAATVPTPASSFAQGFMGDSSVPMILIITESLVSSTTAISDSFTAHRLMGPELVNHPSVCVIEFNPIAPTFMLKALDTVVKKEARDSGRRRIPGQGVLQKLAEIGDVRNAINSLQFLCTRRDDNSDWSGTVASSTKRASRSAQSLSEMEKESMKLISSREITLDMFHAAGKVVYNKREDPRVLDTRAEPPPKPPDHLIYLYTPKVSQVDVETLLNEIGTDIQTFISLLHENYALSCNHEEFTDYLDGCASHLSDCDILSPDSRTLIRNKARATSLQNTYQLGTSDALRQDEIGFQVATRGLLFSLPFPVSRAMPYGARKQDAFKMYYPASLRIWKPTEETNGLIDYIAANLSGLLPNYTSRSNQDSGVAAWQNRSSIFEMPSNMHGTDTHQPRHVNLAKEVLVLDFLPLLARIQASRGDDVSTISKIIQMRGANVSTEDNLEEELHDEPIPGSVRLTQKVEAIHAALQALQNQRPTNRGSAHSASHTAVPSKTRDSEPAIEKLWIEDDDIEDD